MVLGGVYSLRSNYLLGNYFLLNSFMGSLKSKGTVDR